MSDWKYSMRVEVPSDVDYERIHLRLWRYSIFLRCNKAKRMFFVDYPKEFNQLTALMDLMAVTGIRGKYIRCVRGPL